MNAISTQARKTLRRCVLVVLILSMMATACSFRCEVTAPDVAWPTNASAINRSPRQSPSSNTSPSVVQVEARNDEPMPELLPTPGSADAQEQALDELIQIALERNPRIAKASFGVAAAEGERIQAGLYPNPVLTVTGDELGDKTGPGGIWTAPQFSQEIVTGRKLSLSQAVAAREVDQASLNVLNERYAIIGAVRTAFYDAYALQQRLGILYELMKLAEQSVDTGRKLNEKGAIARLDLIQLEVELERVRAEVESVTKEIGIEALLISVRKKKYGDKKEDMEEKEKDMASIKRLQQMSPVEPPAFRRLTAIVGDSRLPLKALTAAFDLSVPEYDLQRTAEVVRETHPEARIAKVGVERAQIALRRAQVEPIPNVSLTSGYTRQNQNRSSDWMIGVSLPIPVWNRNQGNIRTAQAEFGAATQEVRRIENYLVERLATAHRSYAAARQKAERYLKAILPRAEETYKLSTEAFKGGQFEYLRVLQAQRALIEARLEYNRTLGEAWKAAGEISGLLLEETWPPRPIEMKK